MEGVRRFRSITNTDWVGRVIKGDRASIFIESNGLYFRLREAFDSGREVTCFVDPDDPEFSAFEKDLRIIDLVGCIGLGLPFSVVAGLYLLRFFSRLSNQNSQNKMRMAPSSPSFFNGPS